MINGIDQKVYERFENDAVKHQLHEDGKLHDYVVDKINDLSNWELLFYIDLAIEDIERDRQQG